MPDSMLGNSACLVALNLPNVLQAPGISDHQGMLPGQLGVCISGSGERFWLETWNLRCMGGIEVEEGVRSLVGRKGVKSSQGRGRIRWSGFMDAEDKGTSRRTGLCK